MVWRYPAAVGVAYLLFLFLLWLWLRTSAEDYADAPDFSGDTGSHRGCIECHGNIVPSGEATPVDDGDAISEVFGSVAQAEELAVPLFAIIVVVALAFSSMWIVYSAPTLFAELFVDGVLSATLYRRLRSIETHHWLETAVRKTVTPFAITAVAVGLCGIAMNHYYPSAQSLGEVIHSQRTNG